MTAIRRITTGPGGGIGNITAFHAFSVAPNGDLQYSFAADGDQYIQNGNQLENYTMYEGGSSDYRYSINDSGELIISFTALPAVTIPSNNVGLITTSDSGESNSSVTVTFDAGLSASTYASGIDALLDGGNSLGAI
jgi:hypothetical protein